MSDTPLGMEPIGMTRFDAWDLELKRRDMINRARDCALYEEIDALMECTDRDEARRQFREDEN